VLADRTPVVAVEWTVPNERFARLGHSTVGIQPNQSASSFDRGSKLVPSLEVALLVVLADCGALPGDGTSNATRHTVSIGRSNDTHESTTCAG
jgi:hypothetical protein